MANSKSKNQNNNYSQVFQMEAANELGATFIDFHGDQTAKQCGSLGGEMMRKMKEAYNKYKD